MLGQRGERQIGRALSQGDERAHALAVERVGHRDARDGPDGGMLGDRRLHFAAIDLLATAIDDVLHPTLEDEVAHALDGAEAHQVA